MARVLLALGLTVPLGAILLVLARSEKIIAPVADLLLCTAGELNTSEKTCIGDGDILWLQRPSLWLKDFDTPELRDNFCGGFEVIDLATVAMDGLQQLLNTNAWTVKKFGINGAGQRRLATTRIAGEYVGGTLIRKGWHGASRRGTSYAAARARFRHRWCGVTMHAKRRSSSTPFGDRPR